MKIGISKLISVAGVAILSCGLSAKVSAHAPVAALGRTLSIQACSACHQVTYSQAPSTPVLNPDTLEHVMAPSFAQISRKYGADTNSLRAFIRAPRHPMREQKFLPHDLDAIVVYIRSLDPGR
jgi:mono/diheme cytochrome c family protein